jgi:hypothetical protein
MQQWHHKVIIALMLQQGWWKHGVSRPGGQERGEVACKTKPLEEQSLGTRPQGSNNPGGRTCAVKPQGLNNSCLE